MTMLCFSFGSLAQRLSEDTLSGNPYYLSIIQGEEKGKLKNVFVLETLPKMTKYRMVIALYCSDSSLAFNSYHTPKTCVEWKSYDGSGDKITKYDKDGNRIEVIPDSTKEINKDCLFEFYAQNNDSVQVDTIYVKDKKLAYSKVYCVSKCSYINNLKQGKEIVYYEVWELKGECIDNAQRIKMTGSWNKGKKEGEWKYYDVNGRLIRTEIYKKGKLKETIQAD